MPELVEITSHKIDTAERRRLEALGIEGQVWRTSGNWNVIIPPGPFKLRPICYGEIGVYHGANVVSVLETYASHPASVAHAIDPWITNPPYYDESDKQLFDRNMDRFGVSDKVVRHQKRSHEAAHEFDDDYFDILYIDGDHSANTVLEDAVMYFRKVKVGGHIIFDDYNPPNRTSVGINAFTAAYRDYIRVTSDYVRRGHVNTQLFVQKVKTTK